MTPATRRFLSSLAVMTLLSGLVAPAWGAAKDRRATPRTEAPRSAPRATAAQPAPQRGSGSAVAPRTAPRQTAAGRATYGHGSGGYVGYPGWGWYGYPWWSIDLYWGWPTWGPWVYAPPRYPYEAPVTVYADRGPARFELDVTPRRATVQIDGENAGIVKDWDGRWDRLPVDPGVRVLTFESRGYKTLHVRVDAASGGLYRLSYDLAKGEGTDARSTNPDARPALPAPAPAAGPAADEPRAGLAKGFLRIKVSPADAAVYLDGAYFARADELARLRGAVPLAVGTHTIEVVRPGFESRRVDVEIDSATPAEVAIELGRAGD